MSSITSRGATSVRLPDGQASDYADERGFGWIFFSATILGLAGVMRIIDAIWAFGYHGALPDGLKDGVLGSDLKTYGWTWLIIGALLLLSSFLVMMQSQFARWFGVVASAIAAIGAITWMPYYPIWSMVYIVLAVLAMYGLIVYGARTPA